jgi:hypothetical protein
MTDVPGIAAVNVTGVAIPARTDDGVAVAAPMVPAFADPPSRRNKEHKTEKAFNISKLPTVVPRPSFL